jgi:hypothetical protein
MRGAILPLRQYILIVWCLVKHKEFTLLYRNRVGGCGLDAAGSGEGPVAGPCGHGNEP